MQQHLARYHSRLPRYILLPAENNLVRLAGPRQTPWEEGTEIKNISLSGLAFTAPADLCPIVGEIIKIEFEVPGSDQLACFAIVTRLDEGSRGKILVAVKFTRLEMAQRIILAQGIALKIREQQLRRIKRERKPLPKWAFLLPFIALFAWAAFYYF